MLIVLRIDKLFVYLTLQTAETAQWYQPESSLKRQLNLTVCIFIYNEAPEVILSNKTSKITFILIKGMWDC